MSELFLNENMESGSGSPDNWAEFTTGKIGSPVVTWATDQSHSGSRSLKVQGAGSTQDYGGWYQRATLPGTGNKVRVGVWVKIVSGAADPNNDNVLTSFWMILRPRDAGYNGINGTIFGHSSGLRTQDWTYLPIGDYVVSPAAVYLDVELILDARSDSGTTIWFDDLESEVITWSAPLYSQLRPTVLFRKDATANIWTENQCANVLLADSVPSGSVPGSPVHNIVAVKGERQAFQVVVQPLDADWSTVNITNDAFSGLSPTITVKRPRYVTLAAAPTYSYIRGGVVPDPMPVEADVTLAQNDANPFMVEIDIPFNATPGTYATNFYVMKGVTTMATIPVSVEVKNVSLPVAPTFLNLANQVEEVIYHYEDPLNEKVHSDILNRYVDNYRINRIIPGSAFVGLERFNATWDVDHVDLTTSVEADAVWAHMASLDMDTWPPRGCFGEDPGLGMGYTPKYTDSTNTVLDSTFQSRATLQIQTVMAARDAQGCGPFMWYYRDEPDVFDTPTLNGMITDYNFIKSVDNRVTFCGAIKPVVGLTTLLDSMCVVDVSGLVWQTELKAMLAAGKKPGLYPNNWASDVTGSGGDVAFLPESFRLLIWSYWFWGLRSILWWTMGDWYASGVEHNPWGTEGGDGVYTGGDWYFGMNLIYPPRSTSENGPIDTIRYSAMREGMEDIELFQQLQDLIDAGSGTSEQRATAQAALDTANALATHPVMGLALYNDEFGIHDLGAIENARESVIDSILILASLPGTTLSIHIGGPDTISIL